MAVLEFDISSFDSASVGRAIREHRVKKGRILREVASSLGISEPKLSNIETGKVKVDLAELASIGRLLGVSVSDFFPRRRLQPYFVKRREEVESEPPTWLNLVGPSPGPLKNHNPVWPLAQPFGGKHMEPVLARIRPLPDASEHFIAHDHEEFVFVLKGEIETSLKTNDEMVVERLQAGDSLYFRSHLPHCHRSVSAEPAETLNIMYSLRGAIDPDDGELSPSSHRYYRRSVHGDATTEVAEKIVLLRQSQGLSLAELARDIGSGVRRLTQIERGEKSPDVDLLLALARRFRRPIQYFLATTLERKPYYVIDRAAQIHALPLRKRRAATSSNAEHQSHFFRSLAAAMPDRGLHPCYVQARATSPGDGGSPRSHYGQEFMYVLDGEVEVVIDAGDRVVELLRPGDSLFLDSSVPHMLSGRSRSPYAVTSAEMLDIFWSPFGESYLFDAADGLSANADDSAHLGAAGDLS